MSTNCEATMTATTTPYPRAATSRRVRPSRSRRVLGSSLVDLLVGPHGIDRYLELIRPEMTIADARARIVAVERQTARSVTLRIRPNRAWTGFRAGQFVKVGVEIDGVRRTRTYSPASSEHRAHDELELTISFRPDGLVSSYLQRENPGGIVHLGAAAGDFVLPDERPQRLTLVSGGSGITPVLSMLRTLVDEGHRGEIVFLHYARGPQDVPHLAELRRLALEYPNVRLVLAYTRDRDGDLYGRFDETHLATAAPGYAEAQTYLCGPPSLMAAVRAHYAGKGIEDALHTEEFTAPATVPVDESATGTVRFGDVAVDNDGTTLLEQAEAAGLTPEYGCRMGICFSCTKVKTAGCTRNVRTGELHTEADQEIQLCISAPVGDVAIDL